LLFKPVKNIIDKRQQEVSDIYKIANDTKSQAETMRADYEKKLTETKKEASEIIKAATQKAQVRSTEIVEEAQGKAADIIVKADVAIEREKKNAINSLKNEVSGIAISIAEKVIEKDINEKDHEALIEKFIDTVGDAS
ncbi:MAG: F0F1 ATP synthase subunit B, partial [Oscillospiraceae bacterium]